MTYELDWGRLTGDKACLRWNRKNLQVLGEVVDAHVSSHRTVVQAGGNLGVFPKWLAARFQRVVTFEPDFDNMGCLFVNTLTEPNIIKLQAALGYERKSVGMAKVNNWGRTHAGVTHVSGEGLIPTIRLDDLGLTDVDFIQLDTEGYELSAIRGGQKTIAGCRPVIMMEINKNAVLNGWNLADVECLLGALNYTLVSKIGPDKVFLPRERCECPT